MSSSEIGEGEKVELELEKPGWNGGFTVGFSLPGQVVVTSLTSQPRCGEGEPTPGRYAEIRETRGLPFPAGVER